MAITLITHIPRIIHNHCHVATHDHDRKSEVQIKYAATHRQIIILVKIAIHKIYQYS